MTADTAGHSGAGDEAAVIAWASGFLEYATHDAKDNPCTLCNVARTLLIISAELTRLRDTFQILALCEQNSVVLKPNTNYIFKVIEGCQKCKTLAAVYDDPSPTKAAQGESK